MGPVVHYAGSSASAGHYRPTGTTGEHRAACSTGRP